MQAALNTVWNHSQELSRGRLTADCRFCQLSPGPGSLTLCPAHTQEVAVACFGLRDTKMKATATRPQAFLAPNQSSAISDRGSNTNQDQTNSNQAAGPWLLHAYWIVCATLGPIMAVGTTALAGIPTARRA